MMRPWSLEEHAVCLAALRNGVGIETNAADLDEREEPM